MKSSSSGNAAASLKSGWVHLVCRYSPHKALWTHSPLYICWLWGQRKTEMERGSTNTKVVREVEENNTGEWNRKGEKSKGGRQIDKKGEQEKSDDGLQEKKLSPCNIILYAQWLWAPFCSTSIDCGEGQIQGLIEKSSGESDLRFYMNFTWGYCCKILF